MVVTRSGAVATPVTRATRRFRGRTRSLLLELPDDVLLTIARALISGAAIRSSMGLRQVCTVLLDRLSPILDDVEVLEAKNPFWQNALCVGGVQLSSCGRALLPAGRQKRLDRTWAAGGLLRKTGRNTICFRLSAAEDHPGLFAHPHFRPQFSPYAWVGICTEDGRCGWGYVPGNGNFWQWSLVRSETSHDIQYYKPGLVPEAFAAVRGPSAGAARFSHGHGARLQHQPSASGDPPSHKVVVVFDADAGTLEVGLNGHALELGLEGFPSGMAMRPFACVDDRWVCTRLERVGWNEAEELEGVESSESSDGVAEGEDDVLEEEAEEGDDDDMNASWPWTVPHAYDGLSEVPEEAGGSEGSEEAGDDEESWEEEED